MNGAANEPDQSKMDFFFLAIQYTRAACTLIFQRKEKKRSNSILDSQKSANNFSFSENSLRKSMARKCVHSEKKIAQF